MKVKENNGKVRQNSGKWERTGKRWNSYKSLELWELKNLALETKEKLKKLKHKNEERDSETVKRI